MSYTREEQLRLLDLLSNDFLGLARFLLAAQHTIKLLNGRLVQEDAEIQEKVVSLIEIAKETLVESDINPRPFVPCAPQKEAYKTAYYDVLNASQGIVSNIRQPEVQLRLRRLLLPLSSQSRFRVGSPSEDGKRPSAPSSPRAKGQSKPQRSAPASPPAAPQPHRAPRVEVTADEEEELNSLRNFGPNWAPGLVGKPCPHLFEGLSLESLTMMSDERLFGPPEVFWGDDYKKPKVERKVDDFPYHLDSAQAWEYLVKKHADKRNRNPPVLSWSLDDTDTGPACFSM